MVEGYITYAPTTMSMTIISIYTNNQLCRDQTQWWIVEHGPAENESC